ncbi:Protein fem-1 C [Cichlidogyrus casuarinus]|uniref:Protein fem-1 C n=1 Tax=Cichlidogyrus casuarinus TaxID=1844966 RepID=A0ABD2QEQ7_9PLAT
MELLNMRNIPEACDELLGSEEKWPLKPRKGGIKRLHRLRAKANAIQQIPLLCIFRNRIANKLNGDEERQKDLVPLDHPLLVTLKQIIRDNFSPLLKEFTQLQELHRMLLYYHRPGNWQAHLGPGSQPPTPDSTGEPVVHAHSWNLQSMFIRLRLLGPDHNDAIYFIRFRGAYLADSNNMEACLSMWRLALIMQRIYLEPVSYVTQTTMLSFVEFIYYILTDSYSHLAAQDLDPNLILTCLDYCIDNIQRSMGLSYYRWCNLHPWSYSSADKESLNLYKCVTFALHFISIVLIFYLPNPNPFPERNSGMRLGRARFDPYRKLTPSGAQTETVGFWNVLSRTSLDDSNWDSEASTPIDAELSLPQPDLAASEESTRDLQRRSQESSAANIIGGGARLAFLVLQTFRHPQTTSRLAVKFTKELEMKFYHLVYRLVKIDPRVHNGMSLLHLACSPETSKIGRCRYPLLPLPVPQLFGLLRQMGADPNCRDVTGQTPLGLIVNSRCALRKLQAHLIQSLIMEGVHFDASFLTPLDASASSNSFIHLLPEASTSASIVAQDSAAQEPMIHTSLMNGAYSEQLRSVGLNRVRLTSLACLAATAIRRQLGLNSSSTYLRERLPISLLQFVDLH